MNLSFTDSGKNNVHPSGGGSSFDKNRLNKSGNKMKVLNRYEHYINDSNYKRIIEHNKKALKLTEQYFGIKKEDILR